MKIDFRTKGKRCVDSGACVIGRSGGNDFYLGKEPRSTGCYGLNVFAPSQFICRQPAPAGEEVLRVTFQEQD